MSKESILIVDDEEDILELVRYNLEKEGYAITCSVNGEDALSKAKNYLPNVIILDLMLPGIDGLEVCKLLKLNPKTSRIPIIMLTAKGEESDIITGLELGADDYITKPFSPKVLIARIRTIFRRKTITLDENAVIQLHEIQIDPSRHEVKVKHKPVELTFSEFGILKLLASRPGIVFTRYQIVDSVKGADTSVTDRSVDVQIVSLRKKLGPAGKLVETVRGIGYKFRDQE
ncbi:MAG: DNA-binding response regulator [Planctomycetes bacterium GWF2_50_10]|nr:MAG: DNA-binding response regulator [Planctomycetes bacterium GWF2_50_10]